MKGNDVRFESNVIKAQRIEKVFNSYEMKILLDMNRNVQIAVWNQLMLAWPCRSSFSDFYSLNKD